MIGRRRLEVAGALAFCLLLVACTRGGEERPPGRQIEAGNARRYEEGEVRRYRMEVQQSMVARVPNEAPTKQASLNLVIQEEVSAPAEGDPQLKIAVVEATAQGEDAEAEKQHALSRTVTVTATRNGYAFAFPGDSLGNDGEVRIADVAMIAHLLAAARPNGRTRAGTRFADTASIPSGWSDQPISLRGSMTVSNTKRVNDRRVVALEVGHNTQATLAMNVVHNADEAAEGADPILDGYFRRVILDTMGQAPNPILPIALIPAAFIDLTTFAIACIFTLGTAPGCEDLDEREGVVRLRLSGPMEVRSSALVHDSSGLFLSSEGSATALLKGSFPKPPPGRRLKANTARIAGAPIELQFNWTFKESLEGEWPEDSSSILPYLAAGMGGIVVLALIGLALRRRMRGAAPPVQ